jgi:hypothetical protein
MRIVKEASCVAADDLVDREAVPLRATTWFEAFAVECSSNAVEAITIIS